MTAVFGLSHIDRLPLGDLPQTMATLIGAARKRISGWNLTMMGRGSRPIPGSTVRCWGRRSAEPEVLAFITGQVAEGIAECCPAPEKLWEKAPAARRGCGTAAEAGRRPDHIGRRPMPCGPDLRLAQPGGEEYGRDYATFT